MYTRTLSGIWTYFRRESDCQSIGPIYTLHIYIHILYTLYIYSILYLHILHIYIYIYMGLYIIVPACKADKGFKPKRA